MSIYLGALGFGFGVSITGASILGYKYYNTRKDSIKTYTNFYNNDEYHIVAPNVDPNAPLDISYSKTSL